jgi:hypothetical protein
MCAVYPGTIAEVLPIISLFLTMPEQPVPVRPGGSSEPELNNSTTPLPRQTTSSLNSARSTWSSASHTSVHTTFDDVQLNAAETAAVQCGPVLYVHALQFVLDHEEHTMEVSLEQCVSTFFTTVVARHCMCHQFNSCKLVTIRTVYRLVLPLCLQNF